jgi:hypothetical protein
MKAYKPILSEKQLFVEMANIKPQISGIEKGWIRITAIEKPHIMLPHIHYMHNLKKKKEYVKFNINSNIKKIEILKQKMEITTEEIEQVKMFISKNAKLLTKYYFQGEVLDTDLFLHSLIRYDS